MCRGARIVDSLEGSLSVEHAHLLNGLRGKYELCANQFLFVKADDISSEELDWPCCHRRLIRPG